MRVYVLSNSKDAQRFFHKLNRLKGYELVFLPTTECQGIAKKNEKESLLYLDVSTLPQSERNKLLNLLVRADNIEFGILDPKGSVDDAASLLHQGAFDYIGKTLWKKGMTPGRFKQALGYTSFEFEEGVAKREPPAPTTDDWSRIVPGKAYTFCFMFFELDLDDDWRKKSGKAHLDRVASALETHLQRVVGPANGKLWIWGEYGGVILFPFDGRTCDAILLCYRLMLNRTIISAEDYHFGTLLSYRIALHIGSTTYQPRGRTGTIISDTVNFVFHLGHGFAERGNFYLTAALRPYLPNGLEDSFVSVGPFEGIEIFRMRRRLR